MSSITTNNHLPNRRKGSNNNNKISKKQKQQIKKQLPLQWAHITLSHDITKPRYIGGDNSSLNLILEHKVIYLQEKNNTPKWSIKLKDLDDIQGCGQVLQRIFTSQQHYDGDEDTTDLDDECDDYDEKINVATEGMTWRDNVWTLRSKDHKRVICCCLGNDEFVSESSSFQMACGARSFRRTFEKVGDGIVRKEEEKEDEIRLRNGHNNSNNGSSINNDDDYHYHRNNNNNNKNNNRTMTQRKSGQARKTLPKRITTPIRSNNNNNNNNSNNNKRVLFKKNNSTTKKKRKNGDILDDVLYFSSDSDNIVAGKEDDEDDKDEEDDEEKVTITNTTEKEAKVEEAIVVVVEEEKEAQFNDIENGKNDSDDGTIETIINDDDNDDIDNDNDNDNDEDSIEIINDNDNININNNTNIDRSQTLSPPLDLNRIMDQEVHFDEKEKKIITKKTTVMVPGRKRLRRSYGRSLQNRPQQLHNGEADDGGENVNKNNEKIDESNNDDSSDEELFTSTNATSNRSAVVLDDDDSDDDDHDEHVNAHHLSEDNDDNAKKEDTNNDNLNIDEIDTQVEAENNDGTKTPPSSQSILNDHPNDNDDDNSDKNNNHDPNGINDDTIHASSTSTSKSNVTTLNKTKAATLVTPGSHNKKLSTDMKVKTTTTSTSNSSNNNSNNGGNKKMGSIASFFRKKGKDDALTMTATATTTATKVIPAEATTTTTNTTTATTSTSTPTTSPTINKENITTTTKTITKKGARRALLNKFAKKGKDDIKKKMPFHSSFQTNVDKIDNNTSSLSSSGSTSPLPLSMLTNNDKVDDDSHKIGDTATATTATATATTTAATTTATAATITKTPAWALASSKETKNKKITIKKQMSPSSLPNAMNITTTAVTKGAHVEDSKLPPPGNGITLSKSKSTISKSTKSVISSKSSSEIPTLSPSRKNKRKAPSSLTFFNNPYEKTILPSSPTRGTTTAATATTSTTNQNNNSTTAPRHYHNPYKNNPYNNTKQHKRVIAKNSIGLRNMGNTCYLNSSIQLLLNTSQFILDLKTYRDYLLNNQKDTMKELKEVTVAEVDKVEVVGNGNGPLLVLPLTDAILSIARSLGFLSTTTVTNANSTVLASASTAAVPPMVAPAPPSVAASGEASPYFTQSSPEKNIPSMEDEVEDIEDDDDEVPVLITSVNNNVPPSSPLRAATVSLSSILQSRTTTETSATTTPVSPVAVAAVVPTVVSPITSAIDPSPLKRAIDSITNKFIGYEQRDAHEFFSDLIDLLHDELVLATTGNAAAVVDRISTDMDIDADTDTNASNANVDTSSQNVSLLSKSSSSSSTTMSVPLLPTDQYFRMNVNVRLTCDKCGYSRSKEEMYRHLSVEVGSDNNILGNGLKKEGLSSSSSSDGPRTIEKGLRQFFCPEKRELRCEKCKTGETATQTMEVKTFPKALLLHLKRFIVNQDQLTTNSTQSDHRPAQATFCKNNARIAFKENLSSGLFNSSSTVADKDLLHREYKLRGIVHHIGGTALSGHYTTDVLRQRPSSSVGGVENWVTFDDAHATEISSAEVLGDEGSQRNSYMILYGL